MPDRTITDQGLLGKALRLPLRAIPKHWRLPILRGRLRGKKWIVGSGIHGCWLGLFEPQQQPFERTINPGSTVFDIGAHVGFLTMLARELVGPEGRVVAFEPSPRNVSYLREHLRLNRMDDVEVIEAAVADTSGVLPFEERRDSSSSRIAEGVGIQVQAVSLDDLLAERRVPPPDFIKVDVEGAELRVLAGGQSMLAAVRPVLSLATHGREIHRERCEFLQAWGYTCERVTGAAILARPRP
jgi:FkbM family methyltransferase